LPKSNVLPDSIPFFRNGGMAWLTSEDALNLNRARN
jgi:hypothetical protein